MKNIMLTTLTLVTLLAPVAYAAEETVAEIREDIEIAKSRIQRYRDDSLRKSIWANELVTLCFNAESKHGLKCKLTVE
ncbi:MAG: hypothetical protein SGJ18_02325 [Pseudomonadota bacterium]|nr:hypothetical protein [Pseudomonadota bacterium]